MHSSSLEGRGQSELGWQQPGLGVSQRLLSLGEALEVGRGLLKRQPLPPAQTGQVQ